MKFRQKISIAKPKSLFRETFNCITTEPFSPHFGLKFRFHFINRYREDSHKVIMESLTEIKKPLYAILEFTMADANKSATVWSDPFNLAAGNFGPIIPICAVDNVITSFTSRITLIFQVYLNYGCYMPFLPKKFISPTKTTIEFNHEFTYKQAELLLHEKKTLEGGWIKGKYGEYSVNLKFVLGTFPKHQSYVAMVISRRESLPLSSYIVRYSITDAYKSTKVSFSVINAKDSNEEEFYAFSVDELFDSNACYIYNDQLKIKVHFIGKLDY